MPTAGADKATLGYNLFFPSSTFPCTTDGAFDFSGLSVLSKVVTSHPKSFYQLDSIRMKVNTHRNVSD